MAEIIDPELVVSVSHELVAQLAGEELPLFAAIEEVYLADPDVSVRRRGRGDQVLGFGVVGSAALLTPVVLAVVTEVIKHLAVLLSDSAVRRGGEAIGPALRRLFRRPAPESDAAPPAPRLTAGQLAEIERIARQKALDVGLDRQKAGLLADAIVGKLATSGAA